MFASGQVSVFGDICQQRIGASLHYYYFIYFSAYSHSLLTLKAKTLFSLFILCFFREGAITLTGMLRPLWRCAALSGSIIASVLMRCWNGMGLRGVSRVSAPQLVCSGLYSAGDSLFPFFLGVTTMRVVLVFFFCVYTIIFISHVITLCRCVVSSFS